MGGQIEEVANAVSYVHMSNQANHPSGNKVKKYILRPRGLIRRDVVGTGVMFIVLELYYLRF